MTPASRPASFLDSALAYATRFSWPVFPLRRRGKEPQGNLVPNGVLQATTDEATIRAWWNRAPGSNIGLACGHAFFVVDVDPRNGGDETLGALEAKHGQLPETVRGLTGGGGWHLLFQVPAGTRLKGSLGEGVDIKSAGGYIVAPPSVHPSGRAYAWDVGAHPTEVEIATAPDWLLRLATKREIRRDPSNVLGTASQSFLAKCFDVAGWLGDEIDATRVMARCPWVHEHTTDTGDGNDSSTVLFAATIENPLGRFYCSHSHCVGKRGTVEALRELPTAAAHVVAIQEPKLAELAIQTLIRWAR